MKKYLLLSVACAFSALSLMALAAAEPVSPDPSLTITYYYLPG